MTVCNSQAAKQLVRAGAKHLFPHTRTAAYLLIVHRHIKGSWSFYFFLSQDSQATAVIKPTK